MNDEILRVTDLHTSFFTSMGEVKAVDGVSFTVRKGEILGIVGESGSGKSASMLSVLGLQGKAGMVKSRQILFNDKDIRSHDMINIGSDNHERHNT